MNSLSTERVQANTWKGPLLELLLVATTAVESIYRYTDTHISALLLAPLQLDRRAASYPIPFSSLELFRLVGVLGAGKIVLSWLYSVVKNKTLGLSYWLDKRRFNSPKRET